MQKINIKWLGFLILIAICLPANSAHAVIQSLNGQTGQNQTFTNDVNIGISSASNAHTINWSGILGINRGGTGASSFATGSIPFFFNGIFSEGSLFLDKQGSGGSLILPNLDTGMLAGNRIIWYENEPFIGISQTSEPYYASLTSNAADTIDILNHDNTIFSTLDFSSVTNNSIFKFPDNSGTISLLESDQTFTGVNKFEASENSTLYIGSSIKSGCIALGDSDGSGVTYITANDGILSATASKPTICE